MKLNLKETKHSMTANELILKIRKNKWQIATVAVDVFIIVVFILIMSVVSSHNSDMPRADKNIDFGQRLQNYSTFDMSPTRIKVSIESKSDEIYLSDNYAYFQYSANVYPLNVAKNATVTWSASNDLAVIDENGFVQAWVPGETYITATIEYNGEVYKDTAFLRVLQPVTGIYMPTTTVNLYNGTAGQMLTASVTPVNASNRKLIWRSKDEKIATVTENGYVKPVGVGMTEIYAVTEEGGFSAKCFVNVINYAVKVENVSIVREGDGDLQMTEGEQLTLPVSVFPTNARDKTLKWTSTNPSVATVSQTGIVHAVCEGETFINVASNNGVQDMLKLTVAKGDGKDNLDLYVPPAGASQTYAGIADGTVKYSYYSETIEENVNLQMTLDPPPKINGGVQIATRSQVYEHMDPTCYYRGAYKYQFLDLSQPNGVSAADLNRYLEGKGVLEGQADAFIEAANRYGVSELYLVAHAILETGHGTSALATGIEVNGTKVYNMFGIGAYDNSAEYSGSRRAYSEGWTTVSAAIIGGAKFISDYYVNAGQNTLYKILWNPENPGTHQYATACDWATTQALNLDKLFKLFPGSIKTYDIPVFKGQSELILDVNE